MRVGLCVMLACCDVVYRRVVSLSRVVTSAETVRCISSTTTGFRGVDGKSRDQTRDARKKISKGTQNGFFQPKNLKYFVKEVANLAKVNRIDDAIGLLDEMKRRHLSPNAVVYNSLISELGRQGDVTRSFKLFNRMKKYGLVPTDRTYSGLFTACARAAPQGKQQLDKLLNEIFVKGISLSLVACNTAIQALSNHKNIPEALAMLDKMEEQYGAPPDARSFTYALQACAQDRDDGASLAQVVWNDMESRGVKPDLFVYNKFLTAVSDAPSVNYSDMSTWIALPLFRNVESLVKHMRSNGVRPDIRTFQTLSGLITGDRKAQIELQSVMRDCNVEPDVTFMNAVVRQHAEAENLDTAYSVVNRMKEDGLSPDIATCQALAYGCRNEQDVVFLLESAAVWGISPVDPIFSTLLSLGGRRHEYKYLIVLLKLLDRCKVPPTENIVNILDKAAAERPWEEKLKARKKFNFLQFKQGFKGFLRIWKQRNGLVID